MLRRAPASIASWPAATAAAAAVSVRAWSAAAACVMPAGAIRGNSRAHHSRQCGCLYLFLLTTLAVPPLPPPQVHPSATLAVWYHSRLGRRHRAVRCHARSTRSAPARRCARRRRSWRQRPLWPWRRRRRWLERRAAARLAGCSKGADCADLCQLCGHKACLCASDAHVPRALHEDARPGCALPAHLCWQRRAGGGRETEGRERVCMLSCIDMQGRAEQGTPQQPASKRRSAPLQLTPCSAQPCTPLPPACTRMGVALTLPTVLCNACPPCSPTQARAVIDGLPADMVALALPLDVQKICEAGLIQPDWQGVYPNKSTGGEACMGGCHAHVGKQGGWGEKGGCRAAWLEGLRTMCGPVGAVLCSLPLPLSPVPPSQPHPSSLPYLLNPHSPPPQCARPLWRWWCGRATPKTSRAGRTWCARACR